MMRSFLFLLLLFVVACSPTAPSPVAPPLARLSARATAVVEDNSIRFQLDSDAPLARAQLLYGAEGGYAPLDVPVMAESRSASYRLNLSGGLALPRGLSELRYGWIVTGVNGETLAIAQGFTSTLLIPDISPVQLRWQEARADDLSIHYLSGTPAERDIDHLKATALESLSRVSLALNERLNNRLSLYLVPRVFWQGGVAFGDRLVIISYADRAYTGVTARDYFAHEIAHALTQRWGNLGNAGGILSEGVAVYASGGHYQPDLLDQSAATLAQSPLFIPLSILRRDFSNQQHEIAYTISGSFVRFLIDQHGLDNLRAIVRRPNDWRVIYGKDFDALAQDWLAVMQKTPTTNDSLRRWQLKVRYYDLLRRYEEQFDPDARRLPSAPVERWDAELRRALQAPADAENNRVLELMMVSAIEAVEGLRSPAQLELAERYMNEVERKVRSPQSADEEIMAEVRVIVRLAHSQDEALIRRDAAALQATLDLAGHPQFAANFMERAQAQPLWLRFTQSPVRIQLAGDRAYLTVAQWAEPLDRANRNLRDGQALVAPGQRWVLALQKIGGWRIVGRWLDAPDMLKTNQAAR